MQINQQFLQIGYDRSHLNQKSYNVQILVDLHNLFDHIDLVMMMVNLVCFVGIIAFYVYKRAKQTKQWMNCECSEEQIIKFRKSQEYEKEGQKILDIPFMKVLKNNKKTKIRDHRVEKGDLRDVRQGKQLKNHRQRHGKQHRDGYNRDLTYINLICEKCKYVAEVNKSSMI